MKDLPSTVWTHTDDGATVTDMGKSRSRGTPRRVLGENVRRLREEADLLQDELAAEVRIAGPDWTRATVAAVENDRRNVTVEELVALSTALQAPLSVLLFSGGGRVDLRLGLAADVEACRDNVAQDRPVLPSSALEVQRLADTYREHEEAEEHAARRLRVTREAIRHASRELWGRPLAAERDLRLRGPEYDAMEPDTRRAHRGHVSRGLLRELTQYFTDRGDSQ